MFDNDSLSAQILSNPARLQHLVLQELSNRTQGQIAPADPNNGFMFLLEANSSISSQILLQQERVFDEIYPRRATTADQLYRFMSDYDYLDLMAEPASTTISILMDRNELAARAADFNANYKKLVIPANTTFHIGSRTYGIYYPIEIRINIRTGSFLVAYDTTVENPLYELASNEVTYQTYSTQGLDLIKITIPIFQFTRTMYEESVALETGFNVSYAYTDNFMAARVFTYLNNAWSELTYTLSEDVYDRAVPTAKLRLLLDESRVKISIPQVYFNKGLVGSQIRIEIYTSQGAINVPVTQDEARGTRVNFQIRNDTASIFSAPLDGLTFVTVTPQEQRIVGGKTNISFEELRNRVINGSLVNTVPVTPLDIENYVKDNGFTLTKYMDNVTRRIYFANRKLVNSENTPIPVTLADIALTSTAVENCQSILTFNDNMMTLLPTTVYRYSESAGQCTPLSDNEVATLSALSVDDWVIELNSNVYTRTPYHIVTYTDGKYPHTKTFNLNNPSVSRIQFIRENVNSVAQMSVLLGDVLHNGNGTGGFTIRLGVSKTSELVDVDEARLYVLLMTVDKSGRAVHLRATKQEVVNDIDVYHANIATTYHISDDGYIRTYMNISESETVQCDLPLDCEFDVRLMVDAEILPDTAADFTGSSVPSDYSDAVGLVQQTLGVTFGEDLSGSIYNITDVVWSPAEYARWNEIVYHTYATDVYETDADGALVYTLVANPDYDDQDPESPQQIPQLNLLHSAGDYVLDGSSQPIVKHAEDDIKLDGSGQPIILKQRERAYYVNTFMFDARLYESKSETETSYLNQISAELSGYANAVSRMNGQLLDLTEMYLRPIRTIGTAEFGLGNGNTQRMPLGLGFTIKYYVTRAVMTSDALKEVISNTTESIIESHMSRPIISLTAISSELQTTLADNIESVDAVGINNTNIQTLIINETDAAPIVNLKLVRQPDGTTSLEKDITIEFAIAE